MQWDVERVVESVASVEICGCCCCCCVASQVQNQISSISAENESMSIIATVWRPDR